MPFKVPAVNVGVPVTVILSCCVQSPPAPLKTSFPKDFPADVSVLPLKVERKVIVDPAAKDVVMPETKVRDPPLASPISRKAVEPMVNVWVYPVQFKDLQRE